ncbi:ferredoxin family protein [Pelagibius litoralis]|uniref:Ferredoxin n=1 Tax=Pelagibius litoralis TaxID=374515 RepID=A0A967F3F5_9PROT|nr:ferredoxin family protein [Pelagibius litoralis]NIA72504.1 ferredoxin family protein [Pelagibius litoralis]
MTLVITSACVDVKDGICTTSCPVDCIYEGGRMYYIHPTECIECGMCESICPVDAIRYADEVNEDEEAFVALNAEVFRQADGSLAEPGGWKAGGPSLTDPPALSRLCGQKQSN